MSRPYLLAIDQGTTGSRAFIFDGRGRVVSSAYREFKQHYPKPGWVEHDADEIWSSCVAVIKESLTAARIAPEKIAAIGITNQRETTVLWDRATSRPVARAIVWQCRRTSDICHRLKPKEDIFRRKTGLVLDAYFSGTKIQWILENVPGVKEKARRGKVCFGTIDSWLIWKLTGGRAHATDHTNASRTLIYNIREGKWDTELLKILNIPSGILPKVKNSGAMFGTTAAVAGLPKGIPITAVLGDQQAALYGQGCFRPGTVKNTYGTGCFIVLNTGRRMILSRRGLLTTLASDVQGRPVYAMEGSIFIGGAVVQWLRDELKCLQTSSESEELVRGLTDTHGVYFVPAFTGLGAPYWDSGARGTITGLTRGANVRHIVRAALESIAYQTKDVFDVMKQECRMNIRELKVDGGACRNDFLMQFQADLLNCRILRPKMVDSTVFGAALLAGVTAGIWSGEKDLLKLIKKDKSFAPEMPPSRRKDLYDGWQKAVRQARAA